MNVCIPLQHMPELSPLRKQLPEDLSCRAELLGVFPCYLLPIFPPCPVCPPSPLTHTHRCMQKVCVPINDCIPVQGMLQRGELLNHIQKEVHERRQLRGGRARLRGSLGCYKGHDYAAVAWSCGDAVQQHRQVREAVPAQSRHGQCRQQVRLCRTGHKSCLLPIMMGECSSHLYHAAVLSSSQLGPVGPTSADVAITLLLPPSPLLSMLFVPHPAIWVELPCIVLGPPPSR